MCGDVETNPGPTTKICPECSLSVHIKVSMCLCGYYFKLNKITILCPQCSTVVHKKKLQCVCGHIFETISHNEDNTVRQANKKLLMRKKRAMETENETIARRAKNRKLTAERRASEPESMTIARRESNRVAMAGKRASESEATTIARRESNRVAVAGKRASESEAATIARRESSRIAMAGKRSSKSTIDSAIKNFHLKVQRGPEFVCVCCHRMLYKQSVISFNIHKYAKCSDQLLHSIFPVDDLRDIDDKQWVCRTCDGALTRGNIPVQAKANGFKLPAIPPELSCLNSLEKRIISLRVPFMKMVALPSGKQRCIHGPAVNVPSKLDSVCELLPRLPSETELVPLKLKRKLSYKGHYMYDFVRPDKVIGALRWLKDNNPLYKLKMLLLTITGYRTH